MGRLIIDGTKVYELDEQCLREKKQRELLGKLSEKEDSIKTEQSDLKEDR